MCEMVKKLDGVLAITAAFVPDKTISCVEIISAIPVNTIDQGRAVTYASGWFAGFRSGVSQIYVTMYVVIRQYENMSVEDHKIV